MLHLLIYQLNVMSKCHAPLTTAKYLNLLFAENDLFPFDTTASSHVPQSHTFQTYGVACYK